MLLSPSRLPAALAAPLALLATSWGLPAQTTHVVGPSGLAQIRDAIAIAAPGDEIVVDPGTYAHFDLRIGVTIRARLPGSVTIAYDPAFLPANCAGSLRCLAEQGPSRLAPPPGQTAMIVGLDFAPTEAQLPFSFTVFHRVEVSGGGTVVCEDCRFGSRSGPAVVTIDSTLALIRCDLAASGVLSSNMPGLRAVDSTVHAVDSTFVGSQYQFANPLNNPAIFLEGCDLHGSGLSLTGQQNGPPPSAGGPAGNGGPALVATASVRNVSRIRLSDSVLAAGRGACAIEVGSAVAEFSRCTFTQAATCRTPPGADLPGVSQAQPIVVGGAVSFDYRTVPNGLLAEFVAPSLAAVDMPWLAERLLLDTRYVLAARVLGADPTGLATSSWSIPAMPALVGRPIWFQAATGLVFPLRLSPLAGGVMR
jgi:hypothetical protein